MANLHLVTKLDGSEEVTADFYERNGEDWTFVRTGDEVYRIKIDEVLSIAKAPKDLVG